MNKIGAIKCLDIERSADPVKEDVSRAIELLRGTVAGKAFVETCLADMKPERSIRCQNVDQLIVALKGEIGPGGDRGVVDLIEGIQRQFAGARKGREELESMNKRDKDWQSYADKCDEMLVQEPPICPDRSFFNAWEDFCRGGFVDYKGMLERMDKARMKPTERFFISMINGCDVAGDLKETILDMNRIGVDLNNGQLLQSFVRWANAHRDQCDELLEFFKEFLTGDKLENSELWGLYVSALFQVIQSKGKKAKKKKGRGTGPRGRVNARARGAQRAIQRRGDVSKNIVPEKTIPVVSKSGGVIVDEREIKRD